MDSKTNYAIVGFFVLIFSTGIILFAFWLGKYGFVEDYDLYKIYTDESVSGLSVDAAVKYRGVDVGSVKSITIDPKNSEQIIILIKVKKGTPVTKGMLAELKYFGLTGLAYVELTGGSKNDTLLKSSANQIPVIRTKPSLYSRLDTTLTDMTAKISITLDKIDKLLSDKNINNISKTIENSKNITEAVSDSRDEIKASIKNFLEIEKNIKSLTENLKQTSDKASQSFSAFKDMSESIKETTEKKINSLVDQINLASKNADYLISNLSHSLKNGDYNIKEIAKPTLQKINNLATELKVLIKNSEDAIEELKSSPSDLFFKKEEPNLGPGEKLK